MRDIHCFWVIWNPNGNAPKRMHSSRDSANEEAARLARLNPGQDFVILKAVAAIRCNISEPQTVAMVKPAKTPLAAEQKKESPF